MAKSYPLIILFLALISVPDCYSQSPSDTVFVSLASEKAVKHYSDFIKGQSALFTGTQYKEPQTVKDQHPFYPVDDWQWGDIFYNGQYYDNVPFMYDVLNDYLITENYLNNDEMVLVKEKISHFTMNKKKYIQISKPQQGLPTTGFYELMYEGPSRVITRHEKKFEERIEHTTVVISYSLKQRHFLKKGDAYFRIRGKRDLLKVMQDKRAQVRTYINQNNLLVSKGDPLAIAQVAKFYDSLNGQSK